LLVKPTPRNVDLGNGRFAMFNKERDISAVRGGAGIGILHDYAAHSDEQLQSVLPGTVFERSYWIVTHLDMRELSRVRAMSEFILAEVAAQKSIFRTRKDV